MQANRCPITRHAVAWLCALFAFGSVHAEPALADCPPTATAPTPERIQAGMRDARDHGFLWRISKDGRSSFLFGTIHIARLDWVFPGPQVGKALLASDTVALELDLLDPQVRARLAAVAGSAAADELPASLKQRLQRLMQSECIAPEVLADLAPEMQVAALTTLAARRDGLDPAYGIDIFLAGLARGSRKTVVSLETPELQAQALRMPDAQATRALLESALDELEAGRARPSLNRIARVWAEADREAMKRLLDDRNPALADAIAALHGSGKAVFAAVGSLHMVGPLGLPALLARRGFGIERIDFAR